MGELRPIYSDETGARTLAAMLGEFSGSTAGETRSAPATFGTPVIVAEPVEFPAADPDGIVNSRTIRQINGGTWADTGQPAPVRKISNGHQIAIPCGRHGLCVQDSAFWAVNIGTLDPATHPLSGHTEGVAAVLATQDDGTLQITDDRLDFVRRDEADVIADGTLIQLAYVSGTLTIVWAACEPHPDLEGLDAAP